MPEAAPEGQGAASALRALAVEDGLETCNGQYGLTPTLHHGRPVWKKASDPLRYLFFSASQKTWFISDELEDVGFEKAVTDVDLPLGMRWSNGAVLTAEANGDPATAPQVLRLADGLEACNGEYALTPQKHNDRPVWKKAADPERLLFFSEVDKTWYISDDLEDQGFDKATADVAEPLGLRWLKGSAVRVEERALGGGGAEEGGGGGNPPPAGAPDLVIVEEGVESCQGEYALTPTVHNGRPVWKKADEPKRLLFYSAQNVFWYISDEFEDRGFDSAPADNADELLPFGLEWEKGASLTTPGMREEKRVADILAALRVVVEEIRVLMGQEDREAEVKEATGRLAGMLKDARAAGVPDDRLLEASSPPAAPAPAGGASWKAGDEVQICGLASEQGRPLNGKAGVIKAYSDEKGRFEVELTDGKVVFAKAANLQPPAVAEEAPLQAGDRVEIFGLASESGSKLNGREGVISEFVADKERFKVELSPGEVVSLKPANLRAMAPPPSPGKRSASRSSSSSSSSRRKRKKAKKGQDLTPDEMMEKLLTGKAPKRPPKQPKSRPDFEDVADAAARAAVAPLKPGERVEVFGLQSEAGRALNGKSGVITKWDEAKGRFQVELGQANLQSLKRDNLRRCSVPGSFGAAGGTAGAEPGYEGPSAGYTLL